MFKQDKLEGDERMGEKILTSICIDREIWDKLREEKTKTGAPIIKQIELALKDKWKKGK